MSNDKLFGDDPAPKTPGQTDDNQNVNYMEEYVGEGKKYATVDDALKALHHAQQHIPRVEAEAQGMREELKSRLALEDLVNQLQTAQEKPQGASTPNSQGGEEQPNSDEASNNQTNQGLSREELEALVQQTLVQDKQKSSFDNNVDTVAHELEKQWGPGYRSLMNDKAKELGMSPEDLLALAGKSPKAFYNTVGVNTSNPAAGNPHAPPTSSIGRPSDVNPGNVRNWKYYEKIRREDPLTYYGKEIQREIYNAVEKGTLVPGE